jgi:release factor glutamine methyltransferase
VSPGVFHPGLFFSTRILLNYIEKIDLKNKNVLELGAGTGLISIYSAKNSASVTASDISYNAVNNIKKNSMSNAVELQIIHSSLFDKITPQIFDLIIINPPYFPKDPKNEKEYGWFCGNDFQYFVKLFDQLDDYINSSTNTIMILSEDCDTERIIAIAKNKNFILTEISRKRKWTEWSYLFRIQLEL